MVVIASEDREVILEAVQRMYTDVARDPDRGFHFPTGRSACEVEGYPADLLDPLPKAAVASFAGVGFPFAADVIREGDSVLDVGSGSGTDALIASTLVGPEGIVFGLDMTAAMRDRLAQNARAMGATNIRVLDGSAEEIPLPDASVDVVTTNGVLNLVPDKPRAAAEIHRVLTPGGWVQVADIVLSSDPSETCRSKPELWAECIVGATKRDDYLDLFEEAGMSRPEVLEDLDYFAHSPSQATRNLAGSLGARSAVLRARKPASTA
ncbi:MAG: methyltransferase domain-containing protein [Gemmatimonadota bacterium]